MHRFRVWAPKAERVRIGVDGKKYPLEQMDVHGAFKELIDEIEGPDFTAAVSDTLGTDLRPYPQLITIRKVSAAHEGRIHCDSESKIATCLIYMNDTWDSPEGRFRVLKNDHDFKDYVAEASPETGAIVAFKRADHSWHGHTPYVGERRVVQIAWVRSQADIDRKKKRHGLSSFFKNLFGKDKPPRCDQSLRLAFAGSRIAPMTFSDASCARLRKPSSKASSASL